MTPLDTLPCFAHPAVPADWTDEAEQIVVSMTEARAKVRDIVQAVNRVRPGTNKNSVIAKRDRLRKIGKLDDSTKFNSEGKLRRKSCDYEELERRHRRVRPAKYYDGLFSVLRTARKGLADIPENNCRWPFGDPGTAGFHFCCFPQVRGRPYCFVHDERSKGAAAGGEAA